MNQRELQCVARNAKCMDAARLERSVMSHRGMLTNFINLTNIMITILQTTPSQQGAQELERLKQQFDWKVEDVEAGYDILLANLHTKDDNYTRLNAIVVQTVGRHAVYQRKWSRLSEPPRPHKIHYRPLDTLPLCRNPYQVAAEVSSPKR